MYEKLIENYINNKFTKNDIYKVALSKNVDINEDEVNVIYNYIKNDWKTIYKGCNDDIDRIFGDLKNKLSTNVYNQLVELYDFYKKKI